LTQNGGRLLGDQAITLDLANGDLDNQSGLLTAKGPLTLKRLRDLNNQRGEISSNLSFDVIARAVNNNAGKLISGEKLLLRGTTLTNQKGLLSGWKGLSVSGNSLDNRDSSTPRANSVMSRSSSRTRCSTVAPVHWLPRAA
jgi:filamentous hemagglutinin